MTKMKKEIMLLLIMSVFFIYILGYVSASYCLGTTLTCSNFTSNETLCSGQVGCSWLANNYSISYNESALSIKDKLYDNGDIAGVDFDLGDLNNIVGDVKVCYFLSRKSGSEIAVVTIGTSMTTIQFTNLPLDNPPVDWVCANISKSLLSNGVNRIGISCLSGCEGSTPKLFLEADDTVSNSISYFYDGSWSSVVEDYGIKVEYQKSGCEGTPLTCGNFTNESSCFSQKNCYWNCSENWIAQYTSCNTSDEKVKYYIDTNNCGSVAYLPSDNGSIVSCDYCVPDWVCIQYDNICDGTSSSPDILHCILVNQTNYAECCSVTGLDSDCNYNYSSGLKDVLCGNITFLLEVTQYPYVDLNQTIGLYLYFYRNGISENLTDFYINFTNTNSSFIFNWSSQDNRYEKYLLFNETGDYPFYINALYPYDDIKSFSGTFKVRNPYYITFNLYEMDNNGNLNQFEDDTGYILAYFQEQKYHDALLDNYFVPLLFKRSFTNYVFHSPYINGQAVLKLWEANTTYLVRFVNGVIDFNGSYSPINLKKSFGKNFFIDKYYFNGTNQEYNVILKSSEINQYRWLANWLFFIGVGITFVISIFLFFVISDKPFISFTFGVGFSFLLVIFRIVVWWWLGW